MMEMAVDREEYVEECAACRREIEPGEDRTVISLEIGRYENRLEGGEPGELEFAPSTGIYLASLCSACAKLDAPKEYETSMFPKTAEDWDELKKGVEGVARMAAEYRDSLVAHGFTREEALELCKGIKTDVRHSTKVEESRRD